MIRGVALACLVAVAGCAARVAVYVPPVLRDGTAPLGSQTDVQAAQIAGMWVVRRALVDNDFQPGRGLSLAAEGAGLRLSWDASGCDATAPMCAPQPAAVSYAADGPGRWARRGPAEDAMGAPPRLWVFWADGDRRTMAVGDPGGTSAFILDREAVGGADRLVAAAEILDWYGFDTARLFDPS